MELHVYVEKLYDALLAHVASVLSLEEKIELLCIDQRLRGFLTCCCYTWAPISELRRASHWGPVLIERNEAGTSLCAVNAD